MCMAIPSLVVSLQGDFATVECFGVRRTVSTVLMPEPVFPGEYVSVLACASMGTISDPLKGSYGLMLTEGNRS